LSNINFATNTVKVRQQLQKGKLDSKLKTFSSYRTVDLTPSAIKIIKQHIEKCPKMQKLIFANQVGNPHSPRNFTERRLDKIFDALEKEKNNDVKRIKFHALRHTYVSLLLSQGVSVKYIQQQVGHSRINTTMDIYAHLIPEVNEHAVNVLENIISCEQNVSNKKAPKG
jgi:integrase